MFLSDLSIKRPVFASMMMIALVVLGLFSFRRLGLEDFPDVQFPFLIVQTVYPGASPEGVEREVTRRIEEAVNPVQGVKKIESTSTEGFSSVFIEFHLDVDINEAMNDVRAKLDGLRRDLPDDAELPVVQRYDPSQDPIVTLALSSETMAIRDLTRYATETLKRRIENVAGVGNVTVVGGLEREIQIQLIPARLEALGVSPDMVVAALRRENMDSPAGNVERGIGEQSVRVAARIREPRDFADVVVVTRGGTAVTIGQVARIEDLQEEERSYAAVSGRRSIGIEIRRVSGANVVAVADGVNAAVEQLRPDMPAGIALQVVRDNSRWTRASLEDVEVALVLGAILTVAIVFMFLNSWRSTVITGLTLPVSVIASFVAIYAMGFTINTMTLMALSLAIGILIDDAIVVRENIVRHVEAGADHHTAARVGTSEIGFAVLATSLSIIAVFIPVAFMGGLVGKFFYQFGITIAFAVTVSLFTSFTLDPMLSSLWYDPQASGHGRRGPVGRALLRFNESFAGLGRRYRSLIGWALRHRVATVLIALASFVSAFALLFAGFVGGQFMPVSDEGEIAVNIETPVGSSIGYTKAKAGDIDAIMRAHPEIAYTYLSIGGGAEENVTKGSFYVKLTERHDRERHQSEIESMLRAEFRNLRGVQATVVAAGGAGDPALPIQINVLGPDLSRLQAVSDTILALTRQVPGAVEMQSSLEARKPELVVDINRDLAGNLGVSVGSVSSALRTVLSGTEAGTFEDETGLEHDVLVRVAPEFRTSSVDLSRVPVQTGRAGAAGVAPTVPLGQLARIEEGSAPGEIRRMALERMVRIEGNFEGRSLTEVMGDINARLAGVNLPAGYRLNIGGESADFAETVGYILESLMLAIIFVYLILASQFGSFLQPLAIMLSLPLSFIGVILGLWITRDTFNIMSMIGIIMLMGLVTKNAILLVDFVNQARAKGRSRQEALVDAGELRLRPIVMTTLAMIFGMLPTALAFGDGGEFRAPMARAVIGGLITSTLLTLIVVPVAYTFLDDFGSWAGARVKRWNTATEATDAKEATEETEARPAPAH